MILAQYLPMYAVYHPPKCVGSHRSPFSSGTAAFAVIIIITIIIIWIGPIIVCQEQAAF
jgi:hypothetical protein